MRRGDALEPVECLEAALGLPRLAGLGAEPRDESAHVRDRTLLLLEHRLLDRESRRALLLERGVVAGIERDPRGLDVRDVRDAAVEEVPVVRHEQQRPAIVGEPALQPDDGVEVEVVRRLVEQHQVSAAQERAPKVEAHAPAAREARDRTLEFSGLESQAGQQGRRARLRRVAVDGLQSGVQFGERVAVVGLLRRRECSLDGAQLRVPVQDVVEGGLLECRGLLAHGRDAPMRRHLAIAGLRVQFPLQQREQARLAAAVGADQPDAPAVVDLQVAVLDQVAGPAGQGELPELDHGPVRAGAWGRAAHSSGTRGGRRMPCVAARNPAQFAAFRPATPGTLEIHCRCRRCAP